jgi:signal peptidase I
MHDVYRQVARELSGASLVGNGWLRLKVTSQSMSPLLRTGDYVQAQAVALESYRRGDLLVTQRTEGYLTHRLVKVDSLGWYTKGDRNRRVDPPVQPQSIVGLVFSVERQGRSKNLRTRPRMLLASWLGWLGWKEIVSKTRLGARLARRSAQVLMVFTRI